MSRTHRHDAVPSLLRRLLQRIRLRYAGLERENLPRLILFVAALVLGGSLLVFLAETRANCEMFPTLFDSIWWTVVTIATVGYGDKYPVTGLGRVLGIGVIFLGVLTISTLSGTIASIFVDRKMREGKGLQDVNLRNHIVLCGWNANAERIIESLKRLSRGAKQRLVLVNEMDPEDFQALRARHPELDLRFVRGDFCGEKLLRRAGVVSARAAIILSDVSGGHTLDNADERTILATLAIKSLNAGINTSAELANPENESHLRRASVDDTLVNGEFNGFLMASATLTPAIPQVAKELLSFAGRSHLKQVPIPAGFVGRSFRELSEHFLASSGEVLIGVLAEEKKISLDDILSEGSSAIDSFIKKKFAEAELDLDENQGEELQIRLAPGGDYLIQEAEAAFVIGNI